MIVKEMALLSLSGPEFRPAEAEEKLGMKFTNACAPGTIMTRGRYRGLPSPDGKPMRNSSKAPPHSPINLFVSALIGRHSA